MHPFLFGSLLMAKGSSTQLLFVFSVLPFLAILTLAAADPDFQSRCINAAAKYNANTTYQINLNNIFSQITSLTDFNYGFYNLSAGQNDTKVNAIALCRGDRNQDDCSSCLNDTIIELRQRCPFYKEAIGWSEFCMLRYSNRDIFGHMEDSPDVCLINPRDVLNPDLFHQALGNLVTNLSSRAAAEGTLRKYAADNSSVGFFQTVYALVQCTPDLSEQDCGDCLKVARQGIGNCCLGKMGCRVLRPSCFLRFESSPFYIAAISLPSPPPSPGGKSNSTIRIVIIVAASVVGVLLLITFIFVSRKYRNTRARFGTANEDIQSSQFELPILQAAIGNFSDENNLGEGGFAAGDQSLQFDFATVLAATNNFSDKNKLGQGGFGAVYRGKLSNGELVAVKRLSGDSREGVQEFKNEVKFLSKLQHRNLVRLHGFCSEGHEKLLIYEFVPNASLDRFIFDNPKQLNWEKRYKIIRGIARGLESVNGRYTNTLLICCF